MRTRTVSGKTVASLALTVLLAANAGAANRYKADNTTTLDQGTSWTGGTAPTGADVAQFTNAFTVGTEFFTGGSLTWSNVTVSSTASSFIKISPSSPTDTLTLNGGLIQLNTGKTNEMALGIAGANGLERGGGSSDTGTLILSGSNTFTGTLKCSYGSTILTGSLNPATKLSMNGSSSVALYLGSETKKVAVEVAGYTNNGAMTLYGRAPAGQFSTLTLNIPAGEAHYSTTQMKDALTVIKKGAGTMVCTPGSQNTYTGGTYVAEGTFRANSLYALPTYSTAGRVIFDGGTIGVLVGTWPDANINDLLNKATKNSGYLGLDTSNGNKTQWVAFATANLGPLGLAKLGANTLTLTNANTYAGGTRVVNGTLLVNGSVTGAVNVAAGGILGGTGAVIGTVTNLGVITAGDTNTIGVFAVTNLVLAENSAYVWNYGDGGQDAINVSGSLVLPAVATVTVCKAGSGVLPSSSVLFNFGSCSAADGVVLEGWALNGDGVDKMRVLVRNKQVLLKPRPSGTLIRVH